MKTKTKMNNNHLILDKQAINLLNQVDDSSLSDFVADRNRIICDFIIDPDQNEQDCIQTCTENNTCNEDLCGTN